MYRGLTIAVSGKGGVGKTGLAALLIRRLAKRGSLLAIDADADSNLPHALGVRVGKTVGELREGILNVPARNPIASDKGGALRDALFAAVEETENFDIVVMGRPEGEGCYCPVNEIIRDVIDTTGGSYDFTVIDSEAGLEHLSRRTARDVHFMIVVTDMTTNGILTAKRVHELTNGLGVNFGVTMVVANKMTPEAKPLLDKAALENDLTITAYIPYDSALAELDLLGRPVVELAQDSPASLAIDEICDSIVKSQPA